MEFVLIIAGVAAVLLWCISGSRSPNKGAAPDAGQSSNFDPESFNPKQTSEWRKTPHAFSEADYIEKLNRHLQNPNHEPFPAPQYPKREDRSGGF